MSRVLDAQPRSSRELVICRLIDAPRKNVYRAWTEPQLLVQWFAPRPWTTSKAELDVRAGGSNLIVMKSPEGQEMPNQGTYLEVVPNTKLVFTDAFRKAWEPNERPFMVVELTFEDFEGKTKYTARASHWTQEACDQHAKMGFEQGWGACADQLEAVAKSL